MRRNFKLILLRSNKLALLTFMPLVGLILLLTAGAKTASAGYADNLPPSYQFVGGQQNVLFVSGGTSAASGIEVLVYDLNWQSGDTRVLHGDQLQVVTTFCRGANDNPAYKYKAWGSSTYRSSSGQSFTINSWSQDNLSTTFPGSQLSVSPVSPNRIYGLTSSGYFSGCLKTTTTTTATFSSGTYQINYIEGYGDLDPIHCIGCAAIGTNTIVAQANVYPRIIPRPDLVTSDLSPVHGSVLTPGNYTFSGKVFNIGSASSSNITRAQLFIKYNVFDPNSPVTPWPILADVRSLNAFNPALPQQIDFQQVNFTDIPAPPGLHIYFICADVQNSVIEGNDSNNCNAAAFYVPPPPSSFNLIQPATPQCSGTSSGPVNLTWTQSAGAQSYNVQRRLLNPPGSFEPLQTLPAEILGNPVLNYPDTTVQTGSTYEYQILATNPSGATLSNIKSVTTPSCTPPIIQSLNVSNANFTSTTSFSSGAAKTSGRQTTQQGSNWLNPIKVTLNANPDPLQSSIKLNKFRIEFIPASGEGFALELNTSNPNDRSTDNYSAFEYNNGGFGSAIPINGFTSGAPKELFGGKVSVAPLTSSTERIDTRASWYVQFDQNFGDKVMDTRVYVQDQNSLCRSGNGSTSCSATEIQPIQQ